MHSQQPIIQKMLSKCIKLLVLLLCNRSNAELIKSGCEVYENKHSYESIFFLKANTFVSVQQTGIDDFVNIRLKVYINSAHLKNHTYIADYVDFYDSLGVAIGSTYKEIKCHGLNHNRNGRISVIIDGYMRSNNIIQGSNPEFYVSNYNAFLNGQWNEEDTKHILEQFHFKPISDSNEYRLYCLNHWDEKILGIITKSNVVFAILPKRNLTLKHYVADAEQNGIKVYYVGTPKAEDAIIISAHFIKNWLLE